MREAKRHTRWEAPEEAYEGATQRYAARLIGDPGPRAVVEAAARALDLPGRINAIAQTILQLTLPGVPDIYQGTELWDLSLVDPDNRRPVDYALRRRLLEEADRPALAEDTAGAAKLRVTASLLGLRREDPALFVDGDYLPIAEAGPHVFAFRRRSPTGRELLVAVPLRAVSAGFGLPSEAAGRWRDAIGGGETTLATTADLQADWPFLVATRGG